MGFFEEVFIKLSDIKLLLSSIEDKHLIALCLDGLRGKQSKKITENDLEENIGLIRELLQEECEKANKQKLKKRLKLKLLRIKVEIKGKKKRITICISIESLKKTAKGQKIAEFIAEVTEGVSLKKQEKEEQEKARKEAKERADTLFRILEFSIP